jgi:peptidyl-prolyl cis-trans isomerase A (cyclophilin A)
MRSALLAVIVGLGLTAAGCLHSSQSTLLHPPASETHSPAVYDVTFNTTQGPFVIEVHRDWSPRGADRFYDLARNGFYNGAAFFRVLKGFVVQWGLNGDPKVNAAWQNANIQDDAVTQSNTPGFISFATDGPNTRTTQVFINYGDNARLDKMGFSPFGRVVSGMAVVNSLYGGYGEGAPHGKGPSQGRIQKEGAAYLTANFPKLDRILSTKVTTVLK